MAFGPGDLREAARRQRDTADQAAALARMVASIAPTPQMFGDVKAAASFGSALRAARDTQTRDAVREVDRRAGLAADADDAADQAATLLLKTEDVAKRGTP